MEKRITLKNLKVAKFNSEETLCFRASVYFDGHHVGDCQNGGYGGPTDFYHLSNGLADGFIAEMNAWIDSLPEEKTQFADETHPSGFMHFKRSLDSMLSQVAEEMLAKQDAEKRLKRLMKANILFIKDGGIFQMRFKTVPADSEQAIAAFRKKYPDNRTLNQMPFAEAVQTFLTLC